MNTIDCEIGKVYSMQYPERKRVAIYYGRVISYNDDGYVVTPIFDVINGRVFDCRNGPSFNHRWSKTLKEFRILEEIPEDQIEYHIIMDAV